MTSSICDRLIDKNWRSFISDRGKISKAKGIYTIGLEEGNGYITHLYVGHGKNMHKRLPQHKWQSLRIDKFIKEQIQKNGGTHLVMKWVEDQNGKCNERKYIECMARKLGYWPVFNIRRGNSCS